MSIVERYRRVGGASLAGLAQARARLEAAERRQVAQTAQQVAAGQLMLHDPEVRLAMGPEQEAEAYERLNELEAFIGLPPTPYVDVPKQEFAKQIHAGQVTVAERALPAGEREALLDDLADGTIARFGSARVARYLVALRNQQTLAQAAMGQAQGKSEAEAAEPPMEARQWVQSLIEPYAPAAVEEAAVPGRQPATRAAVPATGAKAGPLAGYQWREPATPGGPATAAPPSTETPARPTAPPAPEQAQQPGGPARSVAPHQPPEPMTATEPAVPAVSPTASGPSIGVPPRHVGRPAATPGGRQHRTPSLTDPLGPDVERWRDDVAASFPPDQVENALHVMQGESHGRPDEVGDTHPINGVLAPSYGLFQIRDLEGRWREEGYPSHEAFLRAIQDPEGNIRIAAHIYHRYGWGPWTAARNLGLAPRPHRRARRHGRR